MAAGDRETWRELYEEEALDGLPGIDGFAGARRLTGHASSRRFYRIWRVDGAPFILAVYPEAQGAEVDRYRRTADWFRSAGVRVPAVHALGRRALIVEDGGPVLLDQPALPPSLRGRCYRQSVDVMSRLQRHGLRSAAPNPEWALDRARLRRELEFTEEHALHGWLGARDGTEARSRAFDRLADAVASLPTAVCHRDFHSRNLLVADGRLVVLDFQDVMSGPFLYDLASLLWDDYCEVTRPLGAQIAGQFWAEQCRALKPVQGERLPPSPAGLPAAARQALCLVGLQRSLKALGTFGYQVSVAGNAHYAAIAPRTWSHACENLDRLGWDDLRSRLSAFDALAGVT